VTTEGGLKGFDKKVKGENNSILDWLKNAYGIKTEQEAKEIKKLIDEFIKQFEAELKKAK